MKKTILVLVAMVLVTLRVSAQERPAPNPRTMGGGSCDSSVYKCSDTPNPLPAPDTVWLEEMTWMDIRDALAGGVTTAALRCLRGGPAGAVLV